MAHDYLTLITSGLDEREEHALAGVAFVILAEVLRESLRPLRSTNPSWFRRPKEPSHRLAVDQEFLKCVIARVAVSMADAIDGKNAQRSPDHTWPEIILGDIRSDISKLGSFDLVISSPPYCTRIDYAVATTPELLSLGTVNVNGFNELRKQIMGTVVTEVNPNLECHNLDSLLHRTMQAINTHRTKAAATYYARYFSRYFCDLSLSVDQITKSVPTGHLAFVVQNSYFKEVELDLRGILVEMVESKGFILSSSRKYPSKPTIAESNPKSRLYRTSNVRTEDVLVFSTK